LQSSDKNDEVIATQQKFNQGIKAGSIKPSTSNLKLPTKEFLPIFHLVPQWHYH
jgi:hypothetical protein